jgi:tetratricopeptide (TPR) repeat protein
MRKLELLLVATLVVSASAGQAGAQVSEAERAAARELFRQGDELQRASKFPEALDKFQRAQQVYAAPTNLLRIAECDAALGRLVESAEAYRAVVRTTLPAGSPPAFQAALDQARAELEQVAPRVPKLVVEAQVPSGAANLQLQIDGQSVSAALIGEPIQLDPGTHKVLVLAAGFAAPEQQIELKEQQTKTVSFALKAIPGAIVAPATGGAGALTTTSRSDVPPPSTLAAERTAAPTSPEVEPAAVLAPTRSRASLLFGAHLGLEVPSGKLPGGGAASSPVEASSVGAAGLAYALDGGLRFARQWYVGITLEHAQLSGGNLYGLPAGDNHASSNTTLLAVALGLIVNPDRLSLYGEVGLGNRWFSYKEGPTGGVSSGQGYTSGEVTLGAGLWIPAGRAWRVIPKATVSFGTFGPPANDRSEPNLTQGFFMLGVAGYYNADL